MKKFSKDRSGFTLIEMIIAMGLASMVFTVLIIFENQFNRSSLFISQELSNRQGLNHIFEQVVSIIRSAGPSGTGGYPIESASSTSFVFYSDSDSDGISERIRYTITSSTLERGVIQPTGNPLIYPTSSEIKVAILTNVLASSSGFLYFDANYTGSQGAMTYPIDVSKIRLVQLSVKVDKNINMSPQPISFSRLIDIRNLRSNP